ncbi:hypothetical protein ETH_00031365 [Eimeria tenella]|uniref:Uncharacterized protein n=1 Tax=Eimeria tenella TaxID=5802 RepID=U6KYE7_EIMTE|nr:hypothetical protein ETH_00031365 [Eimeria tenella]CDJ42976.1 hypothetical protein ETH_00031365 [Eimeria tenella]|eukprot:XP_013233726.1 hypothetical protein ETH_00031365 [Eimeria tenella]
MVARAGQADFVLSYQEGDLVQVPLSVVLVRFLVTEMERVMRYGIWILSHKEVAGNTERLVTTDTRFLLGPVKHRDRKKNSRVVRRWHYRDLEYECAFLTVLVGFYLSLHTQVPQKRENSAKIRHGLLLSIGLTILRPETINSPTYELRAFTSFASELA